ncbi:MAG TPA: N-acetylgalactosamine 6-sulfate sulfatase, partial [Planctomycetaceae bacterium]|nr:N-acetylgalactosamine 6-sulfate sulfatase [Planctomycetaceae bacterium]
TQTEAPSDIDGMSLVKWFGEPAADQADREIYFVRREGGRAYSGLTAQALRQGDWKLVHNLPTQAFELYNLADDPREQNDVSAKHPKRMRDMMNALMKHVQAAGHVPWQ